MAPCPGLPVPPSHPADELRLTNSQTLTQTLGAAAFVGPSPIPSRQPSHIVEDNVPEAIKLVVIPDFGNAQTAEPESDDFRVGKDVETESHGEWGDIPSKGPLECEVPTTAKGPSEDAEKESEKEKMVMINSTPEIEEFQKASTTTAGTDQDEENGEKTDDDDEPKINESRELKKAAAAIILMCISWIVLLVVLLRISSGFEGPDCKVLRANSTHIRSCMPCGAGTNLLPFLGEYERTWSKHVRTVLYFFGLMWTFMGMGIVCDQFMAGIEAITEAERIVWRKVHGVRRKFRVKVWNPTVANLTLMALGSSAPEILLTAIELWANKFFSASIGPQTIVGSAAFNLFIISAVCVTALPSPETRRIEGLDAFTVTATMSLIAYSWLLAILLLFSPQRVEIWEGVVTFMMFPILIILAFLADRGDLRRIICCQRRQEDLWSIEEERQRSIQVYGKVLPDETLQRLKFGFGPEMARAMTKKAGDLNQAMRRTHSGFGMGRSWTSATVKKSGPIVGFTQKRHMAVECQGTVKVKVQMSKVCTYDVSMSYSTRDGTARADQRYKPVEGELTFQAGVTEREIEVPIIDDDVWNPEETFMIELDDLTDGYQSEDAIQRSNNSADAVRAFEAERNWAGQPSEFTTKSSFKAAIAGRTTSASSWGNWEEVDHSANFGIRIAVVTILNDDIAGTLVFGADEVVAHQGTTTEINVYRNNDSCGEVSCMYETLDDSAVCGSDYEPAQGTLCFAAGEKHKTIKIRIVPSEDRGEERFKVRLFEPSGGAVFDSNTDGGEDCAICDVIIAAAGNAPLHMRLYRFLVNEDRWAMAKELWADQRRELLYCNGSAEDQAEAGIVDWIMHFVGLNWKLMFLITPPPMVGGGYPCFVVALVLIGAVTTIAGDLASLLGCCIGIPDDITAVTLVALGTSLPDTLASRNAAQNDASADNAIGNITGSNSVNVFLGAGISWTFGAIYWEMKGPTEEWQRHTHRGETFKELFLGDYPNGGFIVPIPSLMFSVALYTGLAFICLSLLAYRRRRFGGELGGLEYAQYRDAIILISLWVIFIAGTSTISVISAEE